jgi:hypothetical protein
VAVYGSIKFYQGGSEINPLASPDYNTNGARVGRITPGGDDGGQACDTFVDASGMPLLSVAVGYVGP